MNDDLIVKRAKMRPEAKIFFDQFSLHRAINCEFYKKVPEDTLDYRMVDSPERKSDSPRESLAHQIYVTKKYLFGIKTGELIFDGKVEHPLEHPESMTKSQLIERLEQTLGEVADILLSEEAAKLVKVPWSKAPLPAIVVLYGLNNHEILHTGWNLAVMDHLNIERFQLLKEMWG